MSCGPVRRNAKSRFRNSKQAVMNRTKLQRTLRRRRLWRTLWDTRSWSFSTASVLPSELHSYFTMYSASPLRTSERCLGGQPLRPGNWRAGRDAVFKVTPTSMPENETNSAEPWKHFSKLFNAETSNASWKFSILISPSTSTKLRRELQLQLRFMAHETLPRARWPFSTLPLLQDPRSSTDKLDSSSLQTASWTECLNSRLRATRSPRSKSSPTPIDCEQWSWHFSTPGSSSPL